jgi:YidC/Oxa1 family membrane protein insertase
MNKNVLVALVLTFVLFMGHSWIMNKYYPPLPAVYNNTTQTNITESSQQTVRQEVKSEMPYSILLAKDVPLTKIEIGEYIISYCQTGGYIKKIALKQYPDTDLNFQNIGFIPAFASTEFKVHATDTSLVFEGQGLRKEYLFDGYKVTLKLSQEANQILIFSNFFSPNTLTQNYQENFYFKDSLFIRKSLKSAKNELVEKVDFAGSRDTFFCAALLKNNYNIKWDKQKTQADLYMFSPVNQFSLYIGPQREKDMQPFGLQGVINYGFFHWIGVIIHKLLYLIHSVTKSWGVSIIILTGLLFVILFPFTAQSTKTMKRMQEVQPIVEELKTKYKDDHQKLNLELIAIYKEYQINPLGGCLPLLFQIPVFFALYQVFMRLVDLKDAHFLWIKDLSSPDHLLALPFPAPFNYLNILPLCIAVVAIIQQKMTLPANAGAEQKNMGLFFAVFMAVIFYNFSSSLVLYWFTQNLLTLTYQMKMNSAKVSKT